MIKHSGSRGIRRETKGLRRETKGLRLYNTADVIAAEKKTGRDGPGGRREAQAGKPERGSAVSGDAKALNAVMDELAKARRRYRDMNSPHEGYAIIKEELDELWQEVKVKDGLRDSARLRGEAVQVAAMAIRFITDICEGGRGNG